MRIIEGIAAAPGIAIAKAYKLQTPDLTYENKKTEDIDAELQRLDHALAAAIHELENIKASSIMTIGEAQAEIFSAHLLILRDPEMIQSIKTKIAEDAVIAETALHEVTENFIQTFHTIDNMYMRERAADITDVSKRILAHLLNVVFPDPALINEQVIIINDDLTPSETAQLHREFVKGFATDVGSRTSHSAIMARSLAIPAVVGTKYITQFVESGDIIILNGIDGEIIINPDKKTLAIYREREKNYLIEIEERQALKKEKTITADGQQVKLAANITSPNDTRTALDHGAEAIGLYRTEFLYMGRSSLPPEDVQYRAYKSVLEQMGDKPVIVRTLDIGGDKTLPYLDLPKEMNPFLGHRAIRYCLDNEHIFRPQLRALLRASTHGNLKIMFPMIATLEEFRSAKAMLLEEKTALMNEGISVSDSIEVGMMVEIPATAILAHQFAKEVDFFSIGTNDLIQYTMAADRMNEKVSYLYQPYHPAILNLIHTVIQAAHQEGKWTGMCGEMASDPIAIPILLGLGLDEFSMTATSILPIRKQLKELSKEQLANHKDKILSLGSADEVAAYIAKI